LTLEKKLKLKNRKGGVRKLVGQDKPDVFATIGK
jgi:hypothetical protein